MKISSVGIFLINSSRAIIGETIDGCRFFFVASRSREKKRNEMEGTTRRCAKHIRYSPRNGNTWRRRSLYKRAEWNKNVEVSHLYRISRSVSSTAQSRAVLGTDTGSVNRSLDFSFDRFQTFHLSPFDGVTVSFLPVYRVQIPEIILRPYYVAYERNVLMNTVSSYRTLPLAEAISLSKLIPSICRARIFLRCIYSVSV